MLNKIKTMKYAEIKIEHMKAYIEELYANDPAQLELAKKEFKKHATKDRAKRKGEPILDENGKPILTPVIDSTTGKPKLKKNGEPQMRAKMKYHKTDEIIEGALDLQGLRSYFVNKYIPELLKPEKKSELTTLLEW